MHTNLLQIRSIPSFEHSIALVRKDLDLLGSGESIDKPHRISAEPIVDHLNPYSLDDRHSIRICMSLRQQTDGTIFSLSKHVWRCFLATKPSLCPSVRI